MPSKKHALADDSNTTPASKTPRAGNIQAQNVQSGHSVGGGSSASHAGGARKKVTGAPSRTGQACDRCKNRKIRCDDTPGGCLPCRQNNTECKTTDRITHRATARGHTETLERDVSFLRQHIVDLEQQLRDAGVEPKISTPYTPARSVFGNEWTSTPSAQAPAWDQRGSSGGPHTADHSRAESRLVSEKQNLPLSAPRTGLHGDDYLGVSPANDLSTIRGTVLSLFGMEIDLADFISDSPDDEITQLMSYGNSTATISGQRMFPDVINAAVLPPYEECVQSAQIYFTMVDTSLPLLHKPAFDHLLDSMYQRGYKPNEAEEVMVHMVVAFIQFQMGLHNDRSSNEYKHNLKQSLGHYHHCLILYTSLIRSRSIQDMQAAAMICIYARNFPKPGVAWSLLHATLASCIELGYHRSVKAFTDTHHHKDLLSTELRKRVFWTLLMCEVVMSGKLGRPMPLRREDFDVELPEPLNYELVRAEPGEGPGQCGFSVAIEYFRMTELFIEVYSEIYCVRPTQNYEETLRRLEGKARRWKSRLPPALAERATEAGPSVARAQTLWMICWECEFQVLLHHPALCQSTLPEVTNRNIKICMEAASKYIETAVEIWTIRAYDTTWYNLTTFFAAIFTLLFVMYQKREQITAENLEKLESDRDICLNMIGDIGDMLGSGERLKDRMREIINTSIERIRQAYDEKNASASASAAVASAALRHSLTRSPSQIQDTPRDERNFSTGYADPYKSQNSEQTGSSQPRGSTYPPPTDPALSQPTHPYSAVPPSHYPPPAPHGPVANYPYNPYSQDTNAYGVANMNIHSHPTMQSHTFMFNANPAHAYQEPQQQPPQQPPFESQVAWRAWFDSTRGGHDTANALMALGGRDLNHGESSPHGQQLPYSGSVGASGMPQLLPTTQTNQVVAPQEWPMAAYDPTPNRNYLVMADGTIRPKSG